MQRVTASEEAQFQCELEECLEAPEEELRDQLEAEFNDWCLRRSNGWRPNASARKAPQRKNTMPS